MKGFEDAVVGDAGQGGKLTAKTRLVWGNMERGKRMYP